MVDVRIWVDDISNLLAPSLTEYERSMAAFKISQGEIQLLAADLMGKLASQGLLVDELATESRSLVESGQLGRYADIARNALALADRTLA